MSRTDPTGPTPEEEAAAAAGIERQWIEGYTDVEVEQPLIEPGLRLRTLKTHRLRTRGC